jgi:hypothetical protein
VECRRASWFGSRWACDIASECWSLQSLGSIDDGIRGPRNLIEGIGEVVHAPSEISPGKTLDFVFGLDGGSQYLCSPSWGQCELDLACGTHGIW